MSNSESSSGGIGFCGLLTIVFITLKLTNYIAWSWLWVLSPLWIPVAIVLGIMSVVGLFFLIGLLITVLANNSAIKKRKFPK
jgi:Transmembrane Fragile-X-F protein.